MPKSCKICGKTAVYGNKITRRGMARKKGGAGRKITGIARRCFTPNLQRIKAVISGKTERIYACTKCIKAGLVSKKI
ncbi:MAG: 50S ribosomal protein L28 [Candidatus Omnitrophica bacterium CG11_big_fil_rev_8_21_14_0_20_42_13]|uniref:Large ribosomal subunit protein bL28 n=1 Tax=Candidatus Ghiorseimicrobium undicola TaxID=1974746 RepID=A0A2H0LZC9_9BACT|nr:MAG: 50S ribosomal protein L28 [Candidatus Omnitrophica bacterium CG11_big_fil_rev_8_21_14_0_20_42_13]